MKSHGFALLVACCATLTATPAFAWPYIDVTSSEVLSVDPPRVRTTFEISFPGYNPLLDPLHFAVTPLDPATLHILECGAPPLWLCGPPDPANSGGVYFNGFTHHPPYVPVNAFSIVADRADPCVAIEFDQLPTMEGGYRIDACLLLDAPVPARPATWGSMKVRYR